MIQNKKKKRSKIALLDRPHIAYCTQTACAETRPSDIFGTCRLHIWLACDVTEQFKQRYSL